MTQTPRGLIPGLIAKFAGRLRFPQLCAFTATLFLLDLVIPDLIPFIDEVLFGLITLLLAMWRKEPPPEELPKPPVKDITPKS